MQEHKTMRDWGGLELTSPELQALKQRMHVQSVHLQDFARDAEEANAAVKAELSALRKEQERAIQERIAGLEQLAREREKFPDEDTKVYGGARPGGKSLQQALTATTPRGAVQVKGSGPTFQRLKDGTLLVQGLANGQSAVFDPSTEAFTVCEPRDVRRRLTKKEQKRLGVATPPPSPWYRRHA